MMKSKTNKEKYKSLCNQYKDLQKQREEDKEEINNLKDELKGKNEKDFFIQTRSLKIGMYSAFILVINTLFYWVEKYWGKNICLEKIDYYGIGFIISMIILVIILGLDFSTHNFNEDVLGRGNDYATFIGIVVTLWTSLDSIGVAYQSAGSLKVFGVFEIYPVLKIITFDPVFSTVFTIGIIIQCFSIIYFYFYLARGKKPLIEILKSIKKTKHSGKVERNT